MGIDVIDDLYKLNMVPVKDANGWLSARLTEADSRNYRTVLLLSAHKYCREGENRRGCACREELLLGKTGSRLLSRSFGQFRPVSGRHLTIYHCLDEYVASCAASPVSSGLWQYSLGIGLTPQLFNTVFKLSMLVRQAPLSTSWLVKLDELEQEISE